MFNLDTLLLIQACVTVLTTALLVTAACYTDSPPEQRWWAAGNVIASLGLALANLPALPNVVCDILAYGLMAFGYALLLRGLRVHCSGTLSWRWIAVITGGALLCAAYFSMVEPSLRGRLCFSGFYFAALNWICAVALVRGGGLRGTAVAVAGFGALGLALFLRGAHLLFHADAADSASSLVFGVTMLAIPLAQICVAFGLISLVMWRYAERLRRLSTLDALTGALNRAGLDFQGTRVLLRALRARRSLTVVMIDVDHFKSINDAHGHPAGDEVLRHLAQLLTIELRPHDLLARFGGEEFVLVLDDLDLPSALQVAERLRARISAGRVEMARLSVRYTVSVGVACSDQHGYDLVGLISAGDAAMYRAKREGRDRVVAA